MKGNRHANVSDKKHERHDIRVCETQKHRNSVCFVVVPQIR